MEKTMTTTDLTTKETPQQALLKAIKKDLDDITPYLETLLGTPEKVKRFVRMAHLAILRKPELLECNHKSLLLAFIWCAYKYLEPGVEDGAWLIPFKGMVVPVPAYKGLIKRAVETETVKSVQPYAVFANDDFSYHLGTDPAIEHSPPKLNDPRGRGALIGAYVVFTMCDGSVRFSDPMSIEEIEKVRNSGAAWKGKPNEGPWEDWKDQMALKTAIKRGFKPIPLKPDFRDLLVEDGRLEIGETVTQLLKEGAVEIPLGLQGEEEPPKDDKKGKTPKTTTKGEDAGVAAFDKLVNGKMEAIADPEMRAGCEELLKKFVTATAAHQDPPMTENKLKIAGAERFESFWNLFITTWEKGQFFGAPAGEGISEAAAAAAESKGEGDPGQGPGPAPGEAGPNEESPPATKEKGEPARDPIVVTFQDQAAEVFRSILGKGVPADVTGVKGFADITPENIEDIKRKIAEYQPPTKRGKK